MRRLTSHPVQGHNSLQEWAKARNPLFSTWSFIIISLCRIMPSLYIKNALYRSLGARIGRRTSIGLMVMFDIFWPDLITIGDNSIIGYNTTILCHEFLIDEYRTGPTVIGENVMIGANTTILAGVTIGDGAVVSAMSLINRDVPPGAVVGGVPARMIRRSRPTVGADDGEETVG